MVSSDPGGRLVVVPMRNGSCRISKRRERSSWCYQPRMDGGPTRARLVPMAVESQGEAGAVRRRESSAVVWSSFVASEGGARFQRLRSRGAFLRRRSLVMCRISAGSSPRRVGWTGSSGSPRVEQGGQGELTDSRARRGCFVDGSLGPGLATTSDTASLQLTASAATGSSCTWEGIWDAKRRGRKKSECRIWHATAGNSSRQQSVPRVVQHRMEDPPTA